MIYEEVYSYIGTPFVHQGRVPGSGLDCVGAFVCGARAKGLKINDFTTYGRESDPKELLGRLNKDFDLIQPDKMQKDDVLLFWVVTPTYPQHVGIFGGEGNFIHAYSRRGGGSLRVDRLHPFWIKKLHSVYRLKVT